MPGKITVAAEGLLALRASDFRLPNQLEELVVETHHTATVRIGTLLELAVLHYLLVLLDDQVLVEKVLAADGRDLLPRQGFHALVLRASDLVD